jgi:hypothetical protein
MTLPLEFVAESLPEPLIEALRSPVYTFPCPDMQAAPVPDVEQILVTAVAAEGPRAMTDRAAAAAKTTSLVCFTISPFTQGLLPRGGDLP